MNFNNLSELKDRVMPALSLKEDYFQKLGYNITSDDIWNYLSKKWKKTNNLSLNEIVNDILKININDVE